MHYVVKQLDFSPVLALFSRLLESNETNNTLVAMLSLTEASVQMYGTQPLTYIMQLTWPSRK